MHDACCLVFRLTDRPLRDKNTPPPSEYTVPKRTHSNAVCFLQLTTWNRNPSGEADSNSEKCEKHDQASPRPGATNAKCLLIGILAPMEITQLQDHYLSVFRDCLSSTVSPPSSASFIRRFSDLLVFKGAGHASLRLQHFHCSTSDD
jgi:hypothetical protein